MEDMDAFTVKALASLDLAELPVGAAEFLEKRRRGKGISHGTVHVKIIPLEKGDAAGRGNPGGACPGLLWLWLARRKKKVYKLGSGRAIKGRGQATAHGGQVWRRLRWTR